MKLYFAPGACSLAVHIVLRELQLPFTLIRVNNQTKLTEQGEDFLQINPKGYVAALMLDNGQVLTEGVVILQYLADLSADARLAPVNGSWPRVRLQEWLNFITAELHAACSPLFSEAMPAVAKRLLRDRLGHRLSYLSHTLQQQDYLMEQGYSVADAYLFTVLGWLPRLGMDLDRWPALVAFMARLAERPAVVEALAAEA